MPQEASRASMYLHTTPLPQLKRRMRAIQSLTLRHSARLKTLLGHPVTSCLLIKTTKKFAQNLDKILKLVIINKIAAIHIRNLKRIKRSKRTMELKQDHLLSS